MKLGLYYRTIITDKNGKIVKRSGWRKNKSFVIGFLKHIDALCSREANLAGNIVATVDTGGVSHDLQCTIGCAWNATATLMIFAPDDNDVYGIVVGTGTTPPTNSDYRLEAKIAQGVGAGQLDYGTHSRTAPEVVAGNVDFVMSRTFYNGSGASIIVNEIGIYCCSVIGTAYYYFCLVRDVITATTVANTQTLTVQYTLRTTV